MSFYTSLSGLNSTSNATDQSIGGMMQRQAYPRTPLERQGSINWRQVNAYDSVPVKDVIDGSPSCHIFVSKRKGFGSTGNHESSPMTIHGIRHLKRSFDPNLYHRYKVNVYLKNTGAAEARKQTRGW